MIARPDKRVAKTLRDIFGWSLPFAGELLPEDLFATLCEAQVVSPCADGFRAEVRVSSLGGDLLLHSAFPPDAEDAVFFGPDTYRFAGFLLGLLHEGPAPRLVVDIGAGAGAGALTVARRCPHARLILTDVNAKALDMARINLRAAGVPGELRIGDGMAEVAESPDLIVANPPFIAGDGGRTYRDGGDMHGARLSLEWALAGAAKLAPGGRLALYTGVAIIDGEDPLQAALRRHLDPKAVALDYRELDPDIFGEELSGKAYADVERIAAVGAVLRRII